MTYRSCKLQKTNMSQKTISRSKVTIEYEHSVERQKVRLLLYFAQRDRRSMLQSFADDPRFEMGIERVKAYKLRFNYARIFSRS